MRSIRTASSRRDATTSGRGGSEEREHETHRSRRSTPRRYRCGTGRAVPDRRMEPHDGRRRDRRHARRARCGRVQQLVRRVSFARAAQRTGNDVAASEISGQRAGGTRGPARSHARAREALRAQRRRDDGAAAQDRGQRRRSRGARGVPHAALARDSTSVSALVAEEPMPSRRPTRILAAPLLAAAAFAAGAQDRMPPLPTQQLTEQQAQALAEHVAARGQPTGPWNVLLRSPELMKRTRGLSDYLRFEGTLPGYVRELVILMTARQWGERSESTAHYPPALDEGLSAE